MSVSNLEKLRLKVDPTDDGTFEHEYDIYPLQTVDISSRKEAFSISPPGLAASDNILLGISGMQADISVECSLYDDGSDRANGTAPTGVFANDTVVTVEEQIIYLEEHIHAPDFSAVWHLDHLTGSAFNDDEVFVETVEPTLISQESPKWKPCRIGLRRGGTI